MASYITDFGKVKIMYELHQLLKDSFDFPDYYGMNMNYFGTVLHSTIIYLQR